MTMAILIDLFISSCFGLEPGWPLPGNRRSRAGAAEIWPADPVGL